VGDGNWLWFLIFGRLGGEVVLDWLWFVILLRGFARGWMPKIGFGFDFGRLSRAVAQDWLWFVILLCGFRELGCLKLALVLIWPIEPSRGTRLALVCILSFSALNKRCQDVLPCVKHHFCLHPFFHLAAIGHTSAGPIVPPLWDRHQVAQAISLRYPEVI